MGPRLSRRTARPPLLSQGSTHSAPLVLRRASFLATVAAACGVADRVMSTGATRRDKPRVRQFRQLVRCPGRASALSHWLSLAPTHQGRRTGMASWPEGRRIPDHADVDVDGASQVTNASFRGGASFRMRLRNPYEYDTRVGFHTKLEPTTSPRLLDDVRMRMSAHRRRRKPVAVPRLVLYTISGTRMGPMAVLLVLNARSMQRSGQAPKLVLLAWCSSLPSIHRPVLCSSSALLPVQPRPGPVRPDAAEPPRDRCSYCTTARRQSCAHGTISCGRRTRVEPVDAPGVSASRTGLETRWSSWCIASFATGVSLPGVGWLHHLAPFSASRSSSCIVSSVSSLWQMNSRSPSSPRSPCTSPATAHVHA